MTNEKWLIAWLVVCVAVQCVKVLAAMDVKMELKILLRCGEDGAKMYCSAWLHYDVLKLRCSGLRLRASTVVMR